MMLIELKRVPMGFRAFPFLGTGVNFTVPQVLKVGEGVVDVGALHAARGVAVALPGLRLDDDAVGPGGQRPQQRLQAGVAVVQVHPHRRREAEGHVETPPARRPFQIGGQHFVATLSFTKVRVILQF